MAFPYNAAPMQARGFNTERSVTRGRGFAPQPERKALVMRKYQITTLMPDGQARHSEQIGPALPLFESAFSAFAHGTLIHTTDGHIPVEDLMPGMSLVTADRGVMELMWMGSMTLMPKSDGMSQTGRRLTRVMPDSFGMGRPQSDVMAGPGARILMPGVRFEQARGHEQVLIPAHQLVDGVNVIGIVPPRPVTVYHLCLRRHAIIAAGGLEVESFHPGPGFERNLGHNMLSLFLSFFPHISEPREFGSLAAPQLRVSDGELTEAIVA